MIADTSSLTNRALAIAFASSPNLVTVFAGPIAAEKFHHNVSWRWGFGAFAIITPAVSIPVFTILSLNARKASKQGLLKREPSGQTLLESVRYYTVHIHGESLFNVFSAMHALLTSYTAFGVLIFSAGLVLFLLPFSIAGNAINGWASPKIIAMIVVGVVLLIIFGHYERHVASHPFVPFELL